MSIPLGKIAQHFTRICQAPQLVSHHFFVHLATCPSCRFLPSYFQQDVKMKAGLLSEIPKSLSICPPWVSDWNCFSVDRDVSTSPLSPLSPQTDMRISSSETL